MTSRNGNLVYDQAGNLRASSDIRLQFTNALRGSIATVCFTRTNPLLPFAHKLAKAIA